MKKNRKLIITEKQLDRINEEDLYGNEKQTSPVQQFSVPQINPSAIATARLKTGGAPFTLQSPNGEGDFNGTPNTNLTEIPSTAGSYTEYDKSKVEEARIRTIKQEGKTYSKADFAKMILGK